MNRIAVRKSILKVLLIAAGLFILLMIIGFHPEDTLYFSNEPPAEVGHFLGTTGARIAAFFSYYIGRAGYVLCLLMLYVGYCYFRRLPVFRKSVLSALSIVLVATSIVFFSLLVPDLLYRGRDVRQIDSRAYASAACGLDYNFRRSFRSATLRDGCHPV